MPQVGGYGCLELVLYSIRELAWQNYEINQSEHSVSTIPQSYLDRLSDPPEVYVTLTAMLEGWVGSQHEI